MNKLSLNKLFKMAKRFMPEILTTTGVVCHYAALAEAIKNTPQAKVLIEEREKELGRKLTKTEVVETCWKLYLPMAIESSLGTACIIGGAVKYRKQNAAIMALYSVSESALAEYKKTLIETVGKEETEKIIDKVNEAQLTKAVDKNDVTVIDIPDSGEANRKMMVKPDYQPCFDVYSGRMFYSSIQDIMNAKNEANEALNNLQDVTLNEFYYLLGMDPIGCGDEIGWKANNGLIKIKPGAKLLGDTSYITMDFITRPTDIWRY